MKKLLYFTMAVAVLIGCQAPTPEATTTDSSDSNVSVSATAEDYKATFDKYITAVLSSDSAAASAAVTADFMAHNMFADVDTSNISQVLATWAANGAARTNQKLETTAFTALSVTEGDYAGDWLQFWGNYSANDNASGADFALPVYINSRMVDGKIAQMFIYYDRLGFLLKTGYTLTPPEGS